jgi:hypothetical protein
MTIVLASAMTAGCRAPCKNNLPPADMLMHPGPGVDGPGPGVMMYQPGAPSVGATSQVAFVGPEGMTVAWDVSAPGMFDSQPVVCPGRYNFPQGAIYRLKLSSIPGRPGAELYPTLEVGPMMPRTDAFLAHNAIPVQFTPEDFDQVLNGNFVTKVIYLPDPAYQELALAGVETLVSTRLDPGVDPIIEADRRGAILGIVRLGNKDLQVPGTESPEGGVATASYQSPPESLNMGASEGGSMCPIEGGDAGSGGPMPMGTAVGGYSTMPNNYLAGVTAPQYGMPTCGTPIGLPGPPSVPMGVPAGLQKHVIKNHTRVHLPEPTARVRVDVKQTPGYSYPKPAHHARIVERTSPGIGWFRQPLGDRHERVQASGAEACENECPVE